MSLTPYETVVCNLADSNSSSVYFNTGAEHAQIVIKKIYSNAKKKVNILTGFFDKTVYNEEAYIESIKLFLLKGGKINVIFNDYENLNIDNPIVQLFKKFPYDVTMYCTEEKAIGGREIHFMTADSKMYRLEYDTTLFKAEFSFNRRLKVKELDNTFENLILKSKKIDSVFETVF